jgi:hypothetical protein
VSSAIAIKLPYDLRPLANGIAFVISIISLKL